LIALDSSSLLAFLKGEKGRDVELLDLALADRQGCLPPVVVTEIASSPRLSRRVSELLQQLPVLEIDQGYWQRAGALRAAVLAKGLKAYLADALIAQSCLDHDVPLITRDSDFTRFAAIGGLKLLG
jgi:predicted nucleic acid-binding protein